MLLHADNTKTIDRCSKHYVKTVNEHRANVVQSFLSGSNKKFPNKEMIPEESKETNDKQTKKKKKRGRPKKTAKPVQEQIENKIEVQKFTELFAVAK